MFLSTRRAQEKIKEHEENIGSPTVSIDPQYQARIQKAVDIVNSKEPGLLRNVTDIIGHLGSGPFGRFNTGNPHTIYVNIQKIEEELKNRLSGQPEETIQQELDNQIVKTIIHEATHQKEFTESGYSSESGPDQAEKQADQFLTPIEVSANYRQMIRLRADLLTQLDGKEDKNGKMEIVLEAHKSDEFPNRSFPKGKKVIPVRSVEHASQIFRNWVSKYQLGATNVGKGIILFNGSPVAYVSYNGKIWNLNETPYSTRTSSIVVAHVRL